jgi:hypothetical protein
VSGWEYVTASVSLPAGTTKSATARCSAGKQIFGGGFASPRTGAAVIQSQPIFTPTTLPPGWVVWARNSGADSTLSVYALCATAS